MSAARYQPFYCEENVWWLSRDPAVGPGPRWAVFVGNPGRQCALWEQRLGPPGAPVVWDYHVVLVHRAPGGPQVWDLDSRLPCPSPAARWVRRTFPITVPEAFRPWFRVVPADAYGRLFSSDRRHMRDERGRLRAPAPPWPPIRAEATGPHTLDAFMVPGEGPGEVYDKRGFERWLATGPAPAPHRGEGGRVGDVD